MKKLKIALAALGFVVAMGAAISSEAKQEPIPCTPELEIACTTNDVYCCDLLNGRKLSQDFLEQ